MKVRRFTPAPVLSIMTYHHIAEDDPSSPFDHNIADATPAQFRRHVEALARYGTPIGIDDLARALDGEPLPKNPVMVTFDDGYRSCHDVALPILRAVGVRATFFVSTTFVTERRVYWWERIAYLLARARRTIATLSYPRTHTVELVDPQAGDKLTSLIKDTKELDVERFLGELARALDVPWDREIEVRHADEMVMTWDQVRALARAGMDVESHGRRHRVLQTLDDASLEDEVAGSRRELEAQLGRPVRAMAYPVGRRINGEQRLRDALAGAGYLIGMSNSSGVNRWWPAPLRKLAPIDRYDIRRLATDRQMSDAMFLTQVAVPRLAYISHYNR
jgi:peptidoglycan/xylan/chitin deacetylase (PgdA/CDA1 family)